MPYPLRQIKTASFEGVAANSTAILRLATGYTYHSLCLDYSEAITTLNDVRVKANGATIWEIDAGDLDSINQFYGMAAAAAGNGYTLPLWFDTPGVLTRKGREATAIGVGERFRNQPNLGAPITTLTVEVDIGAATSPTLTGHAVVSDETPSGVVRKIKRFSASPSVAGDFEISDLPRGDMIAGIHMAKATDDISRLVVRGNSRDLFDRTATVNDRILGDVTLPRTPQSGWYHYDPQESGDAGETLEAAALNDLRVIATLGTAEALTTYVEYVGPAPA